MPTLSSRPALPARSARRAPSTAADRGTRIHLAEVTKDYGLPAPAVDAVSLSVEPGEFMTLLGPSGSGKTTTLNLIAGFETLTSGSISFNGADVSTLPPHRRNLGMLFQNYALFPHMTVAQNVAYPLRERRLAKPEIARRVSEVLALVQLEGRDDHYPSQLSGGQQQRVALARAIVFDPAALLLDEPLGALDRNLRGALQREIQRIHREVGSTFVFVTHDQEEAMTLSDRIALFNSGRIEQVGTPEDLYERPDSLFTARFLGDSTVFDAVELDPASNATSVGWGGHTWTVVAGTSAPALGSGAALVVRPEDLHIAARREDVPAGANEAPAVLADTEYLGTHRTAVLDFAGGAVTGRARLEGRGGAELGRGDEVLTWWRPDRQRLVRS